MNIDMKTKTSRLALSTLAVIALAAAACGDDDGPGVDASSSEDASPGQDRLTIDSGEPGPDAGAPDLGTPADAGPDAGRPDGAEPSDAGEPQGTSFTPGAGVVVDGAQVRVRVGAAAGSTFAEVKAALGQPTRQTPGANTRSHEWDLAVGGTLTIWFNNTGLDANPANLVGETDEVLWIAISGAFPGQDTSGVGIGVTRAAVETAYGAPVRETPIPDPAGTLLSYIRRGVLVAIDAGSGQARSITVTRAYGVEPDGQIDLAGRRLRFGAGDLGLVSWTQVGNLTVPSGGPNASAVIQLLGPPDAQGSVSVGGQNLWMFAYSFIGFEITFRRNSGGNGPDGGALFVSLHAPYYGTTAAAPNDHGIGAARTAIEPYITGLGFGAGVPSSSSADLLCYKNNLNAVGVTYSDPEAEVSAIVLGLPPSACP